MKASFEFWLLEQFLCIAATSTEFVMTQPASIRRMYATLQQRPIPKLRLLLTQNSKTDYALELSDRV